MVEMVELMQVVEMEEIHQVVELIEISQVVEMVPIPQIVEIVEIHLTFVSKLHFCNQVTNFLEANDAPVTQDAYSRFHSTESALIKEYSDL